MGEKDSSSHSNNIIGAISICQGYNAVEYVLHFSNNICILYVYVAYINAILISLILPFYRGTKWLLNWQNFRRFYLYVMTENVKNIIMKHRQVLLSDDVKQRCHLNERDIFAAATLPELDEAYTRRVHNFASVVDMYKWSSSVNYLEGIDKPMVFINAKDDPIIPDDLLSSIKEYASELSLLL